MKKLTFILLILASFQIISFGQEKDTLYCVNYEYITIIAEFSGSMPYRATITEPGGKVRRISRETLSVKKMALETTYIMDLLENYSKVGWVVNNSNMSGSDGSYCIYYLLKREKKNNIK